MVMQKLALAKNGQEMRIRKKTKGKKVFQSVSYGISLFFSLFNYHPIF